MRPRRFIVPVAALAAVVAAPSASALAPVQIPGLQAALRAQGHYGGAIDGVAGPQTRAGVRSFQRAKGLEVDGVVGPRTRAALGPLGRPLFGRRLLVEGAVGWDVSVLQFLLRRSGAYAGEVDGEFGPRTAAAVRAFQDRRGLSVDAIAGPATLAALGTSGPAAAAGARPAPARATHLVRAGETLTGIAARYSTTVDAIAKANGLDPGRFLLVSTKLRVPAPSGGGGPPAGQSFSVRMLIDRWAAHYGIPSSLVRALAWQESGFQNHVVSSAGAFGVMQVTPATWDFVEVVLLGRKVPRTIEGNVRVGTAFLAHLLRLFGGNERLALGAYYRGAAAVQKFGLGPETTRYVENVLALRRRM